jgi:hypothetical protein
MNMELVIVVIGGMDGDQRGERSRLGVRGMVMPGNRFDD